MSGPLELTSSPRLTPGIPTPSRCGVGVGEIIPRGFPLVEELSTDRRTRNDTHQCVPSHDTVLPYLLADKSPTWMAIVSCRTPTNGLFV